VRLLLVSLAAAAAGAWLVVRRRRVDDRRVAVSWEDGSELELRPGSPERERLTRIAEGALR
jgi:hypothetical protein